MTTQLLKHYNGTSPARVYETHGIISLLWGFHSKMLYSWRENELNAGITITIEWLVRKATKLNRDKLSCEQFISTNEGNIFDQHEEPRELFYLPKYICFERTQSIKCFPARMMSSNTFPFMSSNALSASAVFSIVINPKPRDVPSFFIIWAEEKQKGLDNYFCSNQFWTQWMRNKRGVLTFYRDVGHQ